jgi:ATP-dependent 26S proteasome regulatory subunit
VKFELPDEKMRAEIWKAHIPQMVKVAPDVDFAALGKLYDFAGGYIKNAVLDALRKIAMEKRDFITMEDLVFGANIEKEGIFNKEKKQVVSGFAGQ